MRICQLQGCFLDMPAEELGLRVVGDAPCSCSYNEYLIHPRKTMDSRDGGITLHAVEQDIQPCTYVYRGRTTFGVGGIYDAQRWLHGTACNAGLE
jgi:hypothetical protein